VLVALPFVFVVGSMVQRTLWFKFAAERAVGRVVETSGGDAPSITVEYLVRDGRNLRTESDGSIGYRNIARGEAITVFYDPSDPEYARLDLFLENWLAPLLIAVVGGMVFGALAFIHAQVRRW